MKTHLPTTFSHACRLMLICLLVLGSFCMTPSMAQTNDAPNASHVEASETTIEDYTEEQVLEARSRFSSRIYIASAVIGTLLIVGLAAWANRKHRKRLEALKQNPDASLWP